MSAYCKKRKSLGGNRGSDSLENLEIDLLPTRDTSSGIFNTYQDQLRLACAALTIEELGEWLAIILGCDYGGECWELDSMRPRILVEEITMAAKGRLDIDILAALKQENHDEVRLTTFARMIQDFTKAKGSEVFGEEAA